MKYFEVLNVSRVIAIIKQQKVPFSITIAKNEKAANDIIDKYNELRKEVIGKHVTTDESGNWLGKIKEDGTRETNLDQLDKLDVDNMENLLSDLNVLDNTEVDFTVTPIDLTKQYFDTNLNEKSTVEDFISVNFTPEVVGYMITVGLIKE